MKIDAVINLLQTAITNHMRVLLVGPPGVGKTDAIHQACATVNAHLIVNHPAVADPTDLKGFPAKVVDKKGKETATFLAYGDLQELIDADKLTVFFADDLGQASPAVQAAYMQLVLARRVNGHQISDKVVFVAATNDTTHMAGVSGLLEPLKSRWDTIIKLDTDHDAWSAWALNNEMPTELVAFIRFRPNLLSDFKPTREIKNSPSPRGWASVGRWLNAGVRSMEVFAGAVGEGAAAELWAFLDIWKELPDVTTIIADPKNAPVPTKPAALYAVATAIARNTNESNFDKVMTYLKRLEKEFEILGVRDAIRSNRQLTSTRTYTKWAVDNQKVLI